jgi:glucarate dehydratase
MADIKISEIKVTPIAFRDPPLLNASGIHEPYSLRSIIEVVADNGLTGLSETYGDSNVLSALQAIGPTLKGMSIHDLNGLRSRVKTQALKLQPTSVGIDLAPGSQPAKISVNAYSAFEVALLDLQARQLELPLASLLGGAVRHEIPFSAYLFFKYAEHIDQPYTADSWGEALTPAQIVEQARRMISLYGFKSIKLKAGVLQPVLEADCIKALKRAFPECPLRIDPNANWSLETAVRIAEQISEQLEYYEDPVPGLKGMAELHQATGVPLATNMVVTDFDELRRSIASNAVQIVLSDHHYWGGLRDTLQLARMCQTFGLGISMHSNSHLGISLMAMSHVAAACENLSYACDTHYPWQEADDEVILGGKVPIQNGCVQITDAPGLGVDLDKERLEQQHQLYRAIDIRSRDDGAQMQKYDPQWQAIKPRF